MLIHTNLVTWDHMVYANRYATAQAEQGVLMYDSDFLGSRTHQRKLVLHMEGDGSVGRRRRNTGKCGADDAYAATYEQWGWFLAFLFDIDPEIRTDGRGYNGFDNYHEQTQGKFLLTSLYKTGLLLTYWHQAHDEAAKGWRFYMPSTPMRIIRQEER